MSGFLMAGGVTLATAQELPPLDPEGNAPAAATADLATTTTPDVVVKGFMPDWEVQRLLQEGFEKARKEREAKAAAAEKKAAAAKKTIVAEKTKPETKPAAKPETKPDSKTDKVIAEPAKAAPKPTDEEKKAAAAKAQEAADRANGIVRDSKTTAKAEPKSAAPAKKTETPVVDLDKKETKPASTTAKAAESEKIPARADEPKPEPKKTVVKEVPVAPGKNLTVKTTVEADDEDDNKAPATTGIAKAGKNGRYQIDGKVVSVTRGSGGRLRVLVSAGSEGMVQVVVDPVVGMRMPLTGAQISVSGKKVGGGGGTMVVQAESINGSRSGRPSSESVVASSSSSKRYRSEGEPLVSPSSAPRVSRAPMAMGPYVGGPAPFPPPGMIVGGPMLGPPPPPVMW